VLLVLLVLSYRTGQGLVLLLVLVVVSGWHRSGCL
jgi:hypothetical protein